MRPQRILSHESTGPSGEEEAPESSREGRLPRSHGEMAVEKKHNLREEYPSRNSWVVLGSRLTLDWNGKFQEISS